MSLAVLSSIALLVLGVLLVPDDAFTDVPNDYCYDQAIEGLRLFWEPKNVWKRTTGWSVGREWMLRPKRLENFLYYFYNNFQTLMGRPLSAPDGTIHTPIRN